MSYHLQRITNKFYHSSPKEQSPSKLGPINKLHIELIEIILRNLSPVEMERVARVCKSWKCLVDDVCQPEKFVQPGLRGQLNLREHTWVVQSLIRRRIDSKNDETIIQLCCQLADNAIFSQGDMEKEEEELESILKMPATTRIILGIGRAIRDDQFASEALFAKTKTPKHLVKASKTNPFAQFIVGLSAYSKNQKKEKILKEASQKGVAAATYMLHMYDYETKKLEFAASQGSSDANLALSYLCRQDVKKSLEYLTKAAEAGNKQAQYKLGVLLLDTDKTSAIQWLGKAALRGMTMPQFVLGELHGEGIDGAEEFFQELLRQSMDTTYFEKGKFFKENEQTLSAEQKRQYREIKYSIKQVNR